MILLILLFLALPAYAQPVGGEIHLHITDKQGKSLFLHKDSLIYFDNIYQNGDFKIEVKGKRDNYGILIKGEPEGMFCVGIWWKDSLSICITKRRKKMRIILPAIREGHPPHLIRTTFRAKCFKINPAIIQEERQKQKDKKWIDLSFLFE